MKKQFRIWRQILKMEVSKAMIYKLSFYSNLIGFALLHFFTIVFIELVFQLGNIESIVGWEKHQVMFLIAVLYLNAHFNNTFMQGIFIMAEEIVTGSLDPKLVKPMNDRVKTHFLDFEVWNLVGFVPMIALFIYLFSTYSFSFNLTRFVVAIIIFCFGIVTMYSYYLMLTCIGFWTEKIDHIFRVVDSGWEFGQYPKNLFPTHLKFILTYVIPIFPLAYFPTAFFLGKSGFEIVFESFFIMLFFLILSSLIWKKGLSVYSSASS